MFKGLQILSLTQGFPEARLNQEWRANGWRELVIEDFHFAFEVKMLTVSALWQFVMPYTVCCTIEFAHLPPKILPINLVITYRNLSPKP